MVDVAFTSTTVASLAGTTAAQAYLMQQQNSTPADGATVSLTSDDKDRTLNLTPAGALTSLTINFPADVSSRIGQSVCITTTQPVTTVTLGAGPTVTGFVGSLSANDFHCYQKRAANTWIRVP